MQKNFRFFMFHSQVHNDSGNDTRDIISSNQKTVRK